MRTIDLIGKLGLDDRPTITLEEGVTFEIDDSAPTVIQAMALMGNAESAGSVLQGADGLMTGKSATAMKTMTEVCELFLGDEGREWLSTHRLSVTALTTLSNTIMALVMGDGDDEGNAATPATT